MIFKLIFISIFILHTNSSLIQKFTNELSNLIPPINMPDIMLYYSQAQADGKVIHNNVHINNLQSTLASSYGLNSEVVSKFMAIAWAKSVEYQSFSYFYSPDSASFKEIIGAAKRIDDIVEVAFIEVTSSINLHAYKTWYYIAARGQAVMYFKSASERTQFLNDQTLKAVYNGDMSAVLSLLKFAAYKKMKEKISSFP